MTFLAATGARVMAAGSVAGSRHDFSVSGPGPFRAVSETSPCIFCHISHNSGPGLTSRPELAANHKPYESSTGKVRAGAPTGASRICLSCHDGTIAVGQIRGRRIPMAGGLDVLPPGHRSNIGTDLRGSHPISIRPANGSGTHAPSPQDPVHYDAGGAVQCTSCHDPHSEKGGDPQVGKFLVKRSANSGLCLSCHDVLTVAGNDSSHVRANYPVIDSTSSGAFRTVAEAGCSSCHSSHGADPRGRLTRPGKTDDDTCLGCHGTAGAAKLVGADSARPWSHASKESGAHDPAGERFGSEKGGRRHGAVRGRRHAACVDCHNPHAANGRTAGAPNANGRLAGVWGNDLSGAQVTPVKFEYEVCFKCHGDTAPQVSMAGTGDGAVRRAVTDTNLRLVFSPSSPSFHPVAAPGRNPVVPSLKPPYTTASMVYCTDCHASDQSAAAGGAGARGPHGSIYPHLLERSYASADPSPESPSAYALCYKCHDRDKLLSDESSFRPHRKHVVDAAAACATCHDGHGVSQDAGNSRENAHLISFNTTVVSANTAGRPVYSSDGPGTGSCNLTCHGRKHDGGPSHRY
jgi:predicted CXXCH cytochrome family protein